MADNYGAVDVGLTRAINALAKASSLNVHFSRHALEQMDDRGFDHEQAITCLRRGKAHAAEDYGADLRSNVVHRGIGIRVVVGGLNEAAPNWENLIEVVVVTVIGVE